MLQIDNTILSLDIIEKKFLCDLNKCKGACCVLGDSGAPLKQDEAELLSVIFPTLKPYLRKEGVAAIEKQGSYIIDSDGDMVTPLIDNKECAYAIFENGIAKCGIEKAFLDNRVDFRKPISCHLYPIRVTKYSSFEALNYHQWEICKPARTAGSKNNLPVYVFLEQPLVREYGKDWYTQLEIAAKALDSSNNHKK
jgi:hypothetical protein